MGYLVCLFQAHPGGRIFGDGRGADGAALGFIGQAAKPFASCRRFGITAGAGQSRPKLGVGPVWRDPAGLALPHRPIAIHHGVGHRPDDGRLVCLQPALHHGAGRHALVWPCGLFWLGRLCGGFAGAACGLAHGAHPGAGPDADRWRCRGVWLVLRALVGRLPGHADPGVWPNFVVHLFPVGQLHRGQQRFDRRLAQPLADGQEKLLLPHLDAHGLGGVCPASHVVRAFWLCLARQPRLAAAG